MRLRDMVNAGFNLNSKVSDCIHNFSWRWPIWLVNKYPMIQPINPPILNELKKDTLLCISKKAEKCEHSVRNIWEALRIESDEVPWSKIVWSSYCIPKHAFLLWLALLRKLKTQDRMKVWDGVNNSHNVCLLCKLVLETHEHLFFECPYSKEIRFEVRNMVCMVRTPETLQSICDFILTGFK